MRLLTFTNLYPSEDRPRHGIFVEERLRQLTASDELDADVVAVVPSPAGFLNLLRCPAETSLVRYGISVEYMSVPTLPLVTNWIDPWLWAHAASRAVDRWLARSSEPAILDAHFLYPDGVAAVILGKHLGLPVVLTARGSDVNVKCENLVMRAWVRWAVANCRALITVSQALSRQLTRLGIEAPILEVLPNGVDLEKFRPRNSDTLRNQLAATNRVVASVGHLVPEKGHAIAVEALTVLPEVTLLIVGEGPKRRSLQNLAERLGVASRVRFLGLIGHEEMPGVYSAADALVLASAREGMPNVILESLACGTPVVATNVGGIPEVVTSPVAGEIMRDRSPGSLSEALGRLFRRGTVTAETRRFAEQSYGWAPIIARQLALYRDVVAAGRRDDAASVELKAR